MIGLVGLGKMGMNLALNLKDHDIEVIGCDSSEDVREKMDNAGIRTVSTMKELINGLQKPRVVWLMVPAGEATESCVQSAAEFLDAGDIVIDAGNSNYKVSVRRAAMFEKRRIRFLDVGTSGGVSGARHGACLMIGGDRSAYELLKDIFEAISVDGGCMYTGKAGSGHFMKMVHNGIEYGMMQAIGEGLHVMEKSEFDYDLAEVANNWNHGSVIRGWLMEIACSQLKQHPDLEDIKGIVDASGEAKWTVETALQLEVPVPVIALSLMARNASKDKDSFACKVVAMLRNGFGGHTYLSTRKEEN